jgi:hypothetical protein
MGFFTEDPTDVERVALSVAYGVLLVPIYVSLGLFMHLRERSEVIRARAPWAVCAITVATWVLLGGSASLALWWPASAPVRCSQWWAVVHMLFESGLHAAAVWRCLHVIAKAETQRLRLALKLAAEGFETAPLSLTFFQRHLSYLVGWPVRVLLVVYTLWAPVLRSIVPPAVDPKCYSQDSIVQGAVSIPMLLLMLALAFKIRLLDDGFLITVRPTAHAHTRTQRTAHKRTIAQQAHMPRRVS